MNEWIDPKEKLPPNNAQILMVFEGALGKYVTAGTYSCDPVLTYGLLDKDGKELWHNYKKLEWTYDPPLLWMELPEVPECHI